MPRVNRDLQRRMAARRERERRRPPGERRYRFESPEAIDALAEPDGDLFDGAPEMLPESAARAARSSGAARAASVPRATQRATPKPFSAYREEYAYVGADLRRIVLVIGSLLVVLIVLHFVLVR
ncbi:MAG TPA: hypothetical protein VGL99_00170 [Chloroflexota bacterium]|jgi:hypothetical protein